MSDYSGGKGLAFLGLIGLAIVISLITAFGYAVYELVEWAF